MHRWRDKRAFLPRFLLLHVIFAKMNRSINNLNSPTFIFRPRLVNTNDLLRSKTYHFHLRCNRREFQMELVAYRARELVTRSNAMQPQYVESLTFSKSSSNRVHCIHSIALKIFHGTFIKPYLFYNPTYSFYSYMNSNCALIDDEKNCII